MSDLLGMTAAELAGAYGRGETSPVEATRAALEAIDARDAELNAFVLVDAEGALRSAAESEARWVGGTQRGPADGVPTTVKDLEQARGWPTLRGSWLSGDPTPGGDDSPSVARLREAGAVILGKTTTPEFGWKGVTDSGRFGITRNPWDPALTPGGSSGGSAAAVAAGMGTWSVGTDGGGSVRVPAAFTGTVGFKPTGGLVPAFPPGSNGHLSHRGPIALSVLDAATLLDVLARPDARDWAAGTHPGGSFTDEIEAGVAGLTIGYSPDLGYGRNDPEVEALAAAAVETLAGLGARVREIEPVFADPVAAFQTMWCAGIARTLRPFEPDHLTRVDPALLEYGERGREISAVSYLDAMAVCADLGLKMARFHETYDVLVTPTVPCVAFPAGRNGPTPEQSDVWASWTPYTYPFNMTRQPALSVPCGITRAGLPAGLQIVGPRHRDARVLRVGRAYERHTGWSPVAEASRARATTRGRPS
ncbi:amidase [Actinomadura sp. NEAU-AAG7]|uniref:amidase n=1 Tax=Actinomadura sp. NEAU-AAG7 TaxID=2839640 RepID=UPI001BE4A395|nr:amidase [Actinomadura sp. NEAU-AAG7]MBT2208026.1 amidase [Actinomadura sp. NEAU-AAG7]